MQSDGVSEVTDSHELGPLSVTKVGDVYRFVLAHADEMSLEIPPDFEQRLETHLRPVLDSESSPRFEADLADIPGISSRQLGVLLALQKVTRDKCGELPLRRVSREVRRLLDLTKTARFFVLEDTD